MQEQPFYMSSDAIGALRESKAAEMSGGKVVKNGAKDYTVQGTDSMGGKISATVDVIGGKNELITVGGPAKANSLAKWGSHLTRLKTIAEQKGTVAQAYLDSTTPKAVVDLSIKILGNNNVVMMYFNR